MLDDFSPAHADELHLGSGTLAMAVSPTSKPITQNTTLLSFEKALIITELLELARGTS